MATTNVMVAVLLTKEEMLMLTALVDILPPTHALKAPLEDLSGNLRMLLGGLGVDVQQYVNQFASLTVNLSDVMSEGDDADCCDCEFCSDPDNFFI